MSKKSAAVRKLLADLGSAFGKFFRSLLPDPRKVGLSLGRALLNVGLFFVLIYVLLQGIGLIIDNWNDISSPVVEAYEEFSEPVAEAYEAYKEATFDCEQLRVELIADVGCYNDNNCVMTRDESVRYRKRLELNKKYCAK